MHKRGLFELLKIFNPLVGKFLPPGDPCRDTKRAIGAVLALTTHARAFVHPRCICHPLFVFSFAFIAAVNNVRVSGAGRIILVFSASPFLATARFGKRFCDDDGLQPGIRCWSKMIPLSSSIFFCILPCYCRHFHTIHSVQSSTHAAPWC